MPRSNRPRRPPAGRAAAKGSFEGPPLERVLFGGRHTESRHGRDYTVQEVSGATSAKVYRCPGCSLDVEPGTRHIVAWRADGLFGETADLAERRHWHTHCWRIS